MRDEGGDEKLGYCRPPKRTQFQKGHSGNPKGRPKGCLNWLTVFQQEMNRKVAVNENGQRKTITKAEAAFRQLANKVASGDLKALTLMTRIEEIFGDALDQPKFTKKDIEELAQFRAQEMRRSEQISKMSDEDLDQMIEIYKRNDL